MAANMYVPDNSREKWVVRQCQLHFQYGVVTVGRTREKDVKHLKQPAQARSQ